ncbi:MAG: hypothetical protein AVDCRST_MAG12-2824 [uncultured Rubrobacteraceae bacterium]|uniref:Uncharacterized protein n=1 Tax=uncultured Rubrobacteraceae bacterium TaxID=349277 RepID=A0A6J4SS59_9ACTN|nr:MAG: hypothetical protein AVDCRST_MAG12-2824 [uncultured Rubrobacteraceae bacterium]
MASEIPHPDGRDAERRRQGAEPQANTRPTITVLSPGPGSEVRGPATTVRAEIADSGSPLSSSGIKLWLDGRKADRFSYDPSKERLSYRTPRLEPGRRRVLIPARDGEGLTAARICNFRVRRQGSL